MKQHTASEIVFKSDLSTRARIVFMYLSYRSNKENTCFPSIKTIGRECGMAVSTVKRALDDLDLSGYIEKNSRFRDDNGQTSNLYTLVERQQEVNDTMAEVAPMGKFQSNEMGNPDITIPKELISQEPDVGLKSEEQCTEAKSATKGSLQQYVQIFELHEGDRGGGHLQMKTLKKWYPMIRTSSAVFKPQSPLERGEPPPSSFP